MTKIKIVTDTASDIPRKNEDLYDIEVLPFKITIGDEDYTGRTDISDSDFYDLLEEAEEAPLIEAISAFDFGELYYDLLDQGYTDVIYVSVCSNADETYKNSISAKEQFFTDNPEASEKMRIFCLDSGTYSLGYGYAVAQAAKMADRGDDAKEIVNFLQNWFENCVVYFGLYSSKFAKKSEIIDPDSTFVGELLGFRPIMEVRNGNISTEATVRKEAAIVPFLGELCAEEIEAKSPYCILYGQDATAGEELSSLLTSTLGYAPAELCQIGPTVACHTGFEAVGVVFKAK